MTRGESVPDARLVSDSKARWSRRFSIQKTDDDRRLVFGTASTSTQGGRVVVDHDLDRIEPEELERAAYDFTSGPRALGEMHDRIGVGVLVESLVTTAEKRAALGIPGDDVSWWVGFKVEDEATWRGVKGGRFGEFSIGGTAKRTPLDDGTHALSSLTLEEVSLVDQGAGMDVEVALFKRKAAYDEINFSPPDGVREELRRGLSWHEEGHSGDGLKPETVAWARRIANGESISPEKARKMRAWLARHEADKEGEGFSPGEDGFPSPGRVAWALWGGDPAVAWSEKLVGQMEAADNKKRRSASEGERMEKIKKIVGLIADNKDRQAVEEALQVSKKEVMTLVDVQEALPEELFNVVLAALDAAAMRGPEPMVAEVEAMGSEEEKAEHEEEKAEHEEEAKADDVLKPDHYEDEEEKAEHEEEATQKLRKELDALKASIAKEREEVAKERAAVRLAKARQTAREEFPNLGAQDDEIAEVLLHVEDIAKASGSPITVSPSVGRVVDALMKRTQAMLAESALFASLGTSEGGDLQDLSGSTEAHAELRKKARSIQKNHPNLSEAQAFMRACRENPGLYAEHRRQR